MVECLYRVVLITAATNLLECLSNNLAARTSSSFTVYLAAIDYENNFNSWVTIQSEHFEYSEETGVRSFTLYHDCTPQADAIFIRFDNQPEDSWAIDQIFVDTSYKLGPTEEHLQMWHFEHPILMPCVSWLDNSFTYQIGPRNGLFIIHDYHYQPRKGEWIRDWV
ncbi:hypothetical protein DICVIV_08395 [Dictyocaulus viviparus]|uniref:Uncharacterized protein n=1 Tax=Dictyocaulus viviparus TaxID=29172 RepID=A0A0D8XLN8_DICVI|nr:hypothetical protein DICVIV_08395 [Dictyocaulus viviparus]